MNPQPSTRTALLLIADISGFTKFMKLHKVSISHAKQIVVKLINAIVSAAAPPLKLAELEGDAAFFYALCENEAAELNQHIAVVKNQMLGFFRSFYQALLNICDMKLCVCEACTGAKDLRLKIILHAGEVAIEKIHNFEKLFGLDVILAHRLLKNSVPLKEYILMTNPIFERLGDFYALKPQKRKEDCEGIGKVETIVFYPPAELIGLAEIRQNSRQPKFSEKFRLYLQMDAASLLDLLGIRKLQGTFQNLPAETGV